MSLSIEDEVSMSLNNNMDTINSKLNDINKVIEFEYEEYINLKIYFYLILLLNVLFIKRIKYSYYVLYVYHIFNIFNNKFTLLYNHKMINYIFSIAIINSL